MTTPVGDEGRVDAASTLTPRQVQVLDAAARGLTERQTADELFITYATLKSHRAAILERLGARSMTQAVALAYRAGVLK